MLIEKEKWPKVIKAFRDDFGLSQKDLQAHLMLSEKSPIVHQWESGYRYPKAYLYYALYGLSFILLAAGKLTTADKKPTWHTACK